MILYKLAEFQNTLEPTPSGYKGAFLTRRIRLRTDGSLDGVPEGLDGDSRGTGKTQRLGRIIAVPREQPQRARAIRPRLVHDNVEYVFGIGKGEGADQQKVADRHRLYLDLLERAAEATGQSGLESVLRFVRNAPAKQWVAEGKLLSSDEVHFLVEDVDPTRNPQVERFWREELDRYATRGTEEDGGAEGWCLVTGEWGDVGQPMPEPVQGIPKGHAAGNMLVSVNFGAAESYGLEGNRCAPVSGPASEAVCKGLNHLTSDGNHHYRLGDDIYVYWVRGKADRDALAPTKDPARDVELTGAARLMARRRPNEPVPEEVSALLSSLISGAPTGRIEELNFHLLGLTANASRIAVRAFMEKSLGDILAAQGRWLARTELEGAKPPSLFALAACLYRDAKDMPRHVPVDLLRACLGDHRPAPGLLALAVGRNRVSGGPYTTINQRRVIASQRVALIKACLIEDPLDTQLNALNLSHPNPAYHCGRLLFVLENIQERAIPGLNTNVTSRHYGAASSTPGVIFGTLIKDAVAAHLPKISKRSRGLAVHYDKLLSEVLEAVGDEFPRTLDFEGQGLFSLGYFHQRADAYRTKEIEGDAGSEIEATNQDENPKK